MGKTMSRHTAETFTAEPRTRGSLIIKGITQHGQTFRPSDWAQRLADAAVQRADDHRRRFHPLVRIALFNGVTSVVVDKQLAASAPLLYVFLIRFADENELQVSET